MGKAGSTTSSGLGRRLFGVAAAALGAVALLWPGHSDWHRFPYLVYAMGAAQVAGGAAILFRRSAKLGAAVLAAVYLVASLLCVPRIVAGPQIYNNWGNFFEPFALLTGAALVYAGLSPAWAAKSVNRIGGILLGLCSASFAAEQAVYLGVTAQFVPKWVPPGQTFWAIATTAAFALAAVALLTNLLPLLTSRLLTLMLAGFGLLVWVPLLFADPHNPTNWSEGAETFAIAGATWILADFLGRDRAGARG